MSCFDFTFFVGVFWGYCVFGWLDWLGCKDILHHAAYYEVFSLECTLRTSQYAFKELHKKSIQQNIQNIWINEHNKASSKEKYKHSNIISKINTTLNKPSNSNPNSTTICNGRWIIKTNSWRSRRSNIFHMLQCWQSYGQSCMEA